MGARSTARLEQKRRTACAVAEIRNSSASARDTWQGTRGKGHDGRQEEMPLMQRNAVRKGEVWRCGGEEVWR